MFFFHRLLGRKRKKSKPKWNSLSQRNASLLERLLDDIDKKSESLDENKPTKDENDVDVVDVKGVEDIGIIIV